MNHKTQQVKSFFDQTDIYLKDRYSIQFRAEIAKDWLGDLRDAVLLDIGCGDGSISRQFLHSTNRLTLLDLSDQMLEAARGKTPTDFLPQVEFLNADFLEYQPPRLFDVIFCIGVLAHVASVEKTVEQLASMLKPGGLCVVQFTDMERFFARLPIATYDLKRKLFSKDWHTLNTLKYSQLRETLRRNRLEIVKSAHYSLLLPGMDKLSHDVLYRWLKFTRRNPLLARLGTECFLLLQKREPL